MKRISKEKKRSGSGFYLRVSAVIMALSIASAMGGVCEVMAEDELTEAGDLLMTDQLPAGEVPVSDGLLSEDEFPEDMLSEDMLCEDKFSEDLLPETDPIKDDLTNDGAVAYDEAGQVYLIRYVMEYNGKQLSEIKLAGSAAELVTTIRDGVTVYGIGSGKDFYKRAKNELFMGSDKVEKGIVSYTLVMKALHSDGRRVCDETGNAIEDKTVTVGARTFEEQGYDSVELKYNEVSVYANVLAYATDQDCDGVVISSPSGVVYTGLPHRMSNDPGALKNNSRKSASYDIDIKLIDQKADGTDGYTLVPGKDYSVSYRNNVNASVKYTGNTDKADYVQIYDEFSANSRWPAVVINGKGNYSGFTSTVYFDILPAPLSDGNGAAGPFADAAKESFNLKKNGGIDLNPSPKRYAMAYDQDLGMYKTDQSRYAAYTLGRDVTVELQKLNTETSGWERLGDLTDNNNRKGTLAAVTGEGLYRLKLTGMGNYYGSLYDTFNVYGTGKTMFSSLKLKTSTVPYMAPGVDAGSLVTGISTRVTGSLGANVMIDPSDLNVRLEAGTPDAQVDTDGKTALSAGKYRAYVSPKDEAAFSGKYPLVAYDGEASATVTVTGQNLDKKMFSTDWNRSGEVYNGASKDVTVILAGITADEVTLGRKVMINGRPCIVPVEDSEATSAITVEADNKLIIKGSRFDNSLPGRYSLIMCGRKGYAGSSYTLELLRTGALLTSDMLTAEDAAYNAGGAVTQITISSPSGDIKLSGYGNSDYRISYSNNKALGRATATVSVLDEKTGFKRGSSARVEFAIVKKNVGMIRAYSDFTTDCPGEIFLKCDGTGQAGKMPAYKLYQANGDGKKLIEINNKYYRGSFEEGSPAGCYDLKIENGSMEAFDFGSGVIVNSVYTGYSQKAKTWTSQNELKLGDKAALIKNTGNLKVYTSDDIGTYKSAEAAVRDNGRGRFSVAYAGNCYILPVIPELTVDGRKLSLNEGDYTISYMANDKTGSARMIVTLSPKAAREYNIGGSKTYKFTITKQTDSRLVL